MSSHTPPRSPKTSPPKTASKPRTRESLSARKHNLSLQEEEEEEYHPRKLQESLDEEEEKIPEINQASKSPVLIQPPKMSHQTSSTSPAQESGRI